MSYCYKLSVSITIVKYLTSHVGKETLHHASLSLCLAHSTFSPGDLGVDYSSAASAPHMQLVTTFFLSHI